MDVPSETLGIRAVRGKMLNFVGRHGEMQEGNLLKSSLLARVWVEDPRRYKLRRSFAFTQNDAAYQKGAGHQPSLE
ncbi:hypothetical protein SOPP22_14500 [Shewanella sp. OPT22]|nr:hypothetical protein SOPP22_14500 [Shewanella sp. OPT22]